MMAWVHASVGAALGSKIQNRTTAFAAGVVSHLVCDLVPHRDFELPVELPLLLVALWIIGKHFGADSSEFAGAMGAISPDFENGLKRIGLMKYTYFPTHTHKPWFVGHGLAIKSPLNQILLVLISFAIIKINRRNRSH